MKIALDYDGTFTADVSLWSYFLGMCRAKGHEVKIVTSRSPDMPIDWFDLYEGYQVPVIYTSKEQKREHCAKIGWVPHVWIDDMPETIVCMDTLSIMDMIIRG